MLKIKLILALVLFNVLDLSLCNSFFLSSSFLSSQSLSFPSLISRKKQETSPSPSPQKQRGLQNYCTLLTQHTSHITIQMDLARTNLDACNAYRKNLSTRIFSSALEYLQTNEVAKTLRNKGQEFRR